MKYQIRHCCCGFFVVLFLLIITNIHGKSLEDTIFLDSIYDSTNILDVSAEKAEKIIDFGKKYLGKPYRYKLSNGSFLDCSGFVSYIYAQQGISLPHSSSSIATLTDKIKLEDIKKGDLLFFKGRNSRTSYVGHVAMVVSVDSNYIQMMHSCCSKGVVIEKYNGNHYYTSRFLFAGRLPQIATPTLSVSDTLQVADSVHIQTDSLKNNASAVLPQNDKEKPKNIPDTSSNIELRATLNVQNENREKH